MVRPQCPAQGSSRRSRVALWGYVQPDMAKQLDDWRRKQEDLPGRPEAIRRLIEIGLKVKK